MKRLTSPEQRHLIHVAQDNITRLIKIVVDSDIEATPIQRCAIRMALDSVANLESLLSGVDEIPFYMTEQAWLKPYLSRVDRD